MDSAKERDIPLPPLAAFLFWFAVVALLLCEGFLPSGVTEESWYVIGARVLLNLLIAFWVYADATIRGWRDQRATIYAILSGVLTEILIPVYLVKSRGWKGAARSVGRFFLYLIAVVVALVVAAFLMDAIGLADLAAH